MPHVALLHYIRDARMSGISKLIMKRGEKRQADDYCLRMEKTTNGKTPVGGLAVSMRPTVFMEAATRSAPLLAKGLMELCEEVFQHGLPLLSVGLSA